MTLPGGDTRARSCARTLAFNEGDQTLKVTRIPGDTWLEIWEDGLDLNRPTSMGVPGSMSDPTDEAAWTGANARWRIALGELEASFLQVEAELGLLTEIDRLILRNRPIEDVAELVIERVRSVLEVDSAALEHLGAGSLEVAYATPELSWPHDWWVGKSGAVDDLRAGRSTEVTTTEPEGLVISVPIRPKEHTIACLSIWSRQPDSLNGSARKFLKSVARQLSIAYDKAHLLESDELLADLDALFFDGASERDTVHKLLSAIAQHFTSLPDHRGDRLQILFPTADERLEIVYSSNADDLGLIVPMASVSGAALRENQTIVIDDVNSTSRHYHAFLGDDVRSECAVPILLGEKAVAVFNVESDREAAYSGYAAYFIEQYVRQLRFLLAFARVREDITDQIEISSADEVFVMMAGAAADLLHQVNNKLSALNYRLTQVGETTGEEQALLIEKCKSLAADALAAPEAMKERLSEVAAPDINSVISRVATSLSNDFEELEVKTDLAPGLPTVRTFLLHEVLENVMRNAANAVTTSPRPGLPPEINVTSSLRRKASAVPMIDIEIVDNGPGMTAEQQARLFEIRSSSRAESSRRSPAGWGFGMFFVDKAVRRVGGEVLVDSNPAVGTRVRLTFPVTRSQLEAVPAAEDLPDTTQGEPCP